MRRYLNSKSDAQLRGDSVTVASLHSSCAPEDLSNGSSSAVIDPCGLVAWSYFNDTFLVSSSHPQGHISRRSDLQTVLYAFCHARLQAASDWVLHCQTLVSSLLPARKLERCRAICIACLTCSSLMCCDL